MDLVEDIDFGHVGVFVATAPIWLCLGTVGGVLADAFDFLLGEGVHADIFHNDSFDRYEDENAEVIVTRNAFPCSVNSLAGW